MLWLRNITLRNCGCCVCVAGSQQWRCTQCRWVSVYTRLVAAVPACLPPQQEWRGSPASIEFANTVRRFCSSTSRSCDFNWRSFWLQLKPLEGAPYLQREAKNAAWSLLNRYPVFFKCKTKIWWWWCIRIRHNWSQLGVLFGVDTDCGLKNPMDLCLLGTCQWLTAAINAVQPPIRKYLQDYFKVSYLIIKFTPIIPDWRKYRYHSHCCYERKKLESKIHVKVIWTG